MALDLGELTLRLEVENNIGRGLAGAKAELQTLPPAAQREMVRVTRVMDEEGRNSGGTLAKGINQGLVRNSPLIVAGVGAALAAGAPVMLAAAGTMFAGIGAAAAAQTVEIRSAWSNLGRDIRDGAVEDAGVLIPVYTEMADRIGGEFRKLRPQMREAFADSEPLIRSVTGGVIDLADNAMPGLVRAIAAGAPVFDGLESFLGSTGAGLTGFFDAMSGHSGAAGESMGELGDAMAILLPLVGELLGQGAELASDVLPLVNSSLGMVLATTRALGPALPAVAAGFLAFRSAKLAGDLVGGLGTRLTDLSSKGTTAAAATSRVGKALSSMAPAIPIAGAVIALISARFSQGAEEMAKFSDAAEQAFLKLQVGGTAAEEAQKQLDALRSVSERVGNGFGTFGSELSDRYKDAAEAAHHAEAAMTPLERATQGVSIAQEDLAAKIDEFGQNSPQAASAADDLTAAQKALADANAATEMAMHGVTAAMLEQADEALAAIDSGFAYRRSVDGLEDAQAKLADTIKNRTNADKDLRTSAEDVRRAQLDVEEQTYRTALAFGQQQADMSGLSKDSLEYKRIVQEEMLGELYRLRDAAGPEMAAAIQSQINSLQASGVALASTGASASTVAQQMRDLGLSVTQVPGNKTVFIDAPTADQKRRLEELGLVTRTLPNGRIYVTADTSPAAGTLAAFMNQRRVIQIQAQLDTGGIRYTGAGQQPTARASGGPVWPGQTFLVGEEGPELVRFAGRGEVLPADKTAALASGSAQPTRGGGSSGLVINDNRTVNAYGLDEAALARRLGDEQRDLEFLAGAS